MCYYYPNEAKLGGAIMAVVYFCSIRMLLVAGLSITFGYLLSLEHMFSILVITNRASLHNPNFKSIFRNRITYTPTFNFGLWFESLKVVLIERKSGKLRLFNLIIRLLIITTNRQNSFIERKRGELREDMRVVEPCSVNKNIEWN
jgi:hypothetical protein